MNNDLISREALKKSVKDELERLSCVLYKHNDYYIATKRSFETVLDIIDNAPTVEERPQGEWSFNPYDSCSYCSLCKVKAPFGYKNYCPNCGADMQKGGAE